MPCRSSAVGLLPYAFNSRFRGTRERTTFPRPSGPNLAVRLARSEASAGHRSRARQISCPYQVIFARESKWLHWREAGPRVPGPNAVSAAVADVAAILQNSRWLRLTH